MARLAVLSIVAAVFVASAPLANNEDVARTLDMGVLPTVKSTSREAIPAELVDGGIADDIPKDLLVKGPKVNGGFALNVLPIDSSEKSVANADCAGYMVNGKCTTQFPHRSRTAVIEDNMLSPEQNTSKAVEPDARQIIQQYFKHSMMQETKPETHNAGLPGFDVVEEEMNKVDNIQADAESDSLFPVGSGLMVHDDSEVDAIGSSAKMNIESREQEGPESHQLPESGLAPSNEIIANSGAPREGSYTVLRAMPLSLIAAEPQMSSSGEELAMPMQSQSSTTLMSEEVGDLEENLPSTKYDAELEIADPSIRQKPAQDALPQQVTPQTPERPTAETDDTTELAQTDAVKYDPNDIKGNYLSLVSYCTRKASERLQNAPHTASELAVTLTKYASALACADLEAFPSCMPSEAKAILENPPHHGQWNCF